MLDFLTRSKIGKKVNSSYSKDGKDIQILNLFNEKLVFNSSLYNKLYYFGPENFGLKATGKELDLEGLLLNDDFHDLVKQGWTGFRLYPDKGNRFAEIYVPDIYAEAVLHAINGLNKKINFGPSTALLYGQWAEYKNRDIEGFFKNLGGISLFDKKCQMSLDDVADLYKKVDSLTFAGLNLKLNTSDVNGYMSTLKNNYKQWLNIYVDIRLNKKFISNKDSIKLISGFESADKRLGEDGIYLVKVKRTDGIFTALLLEGEDRAKNGKTYVLSGFGNEYVDTASIL